MRTKSFEVRVRYYELKAALSVAHGRQYTKKVSLRCAITGQAMAQRRLQKNAVKGPKGHTGAMYVPEAAMKEFFSWTRRISRIQKELNFGRAIIREINREIKELGDA